MMGDRDYRALIKKAIDSIGKEVELQIDVNDIKTIHLDEVVRCLRRSYYDRIEPKEVEKTGFTDLVGGLLRSKGYGSKIDEFEIDGLKLKGQTDMIVDDVVFVFRSAHKLPDNPIAYDLLYLNACMWIFDKAEGILVYLTGDKKETSFSLSRNKKMFEEVVRRVRVFNDLLKEKKVPILEPSVECNDCQYYEKCYIKQKISKSISIKDLVGMNK
ncbi:MAG TPA: Dna2/Cas4 domain-containing protein [Nitrosopumilaceae archaeon]|nr:Dna2/Cas4 domain-containing protein [Nitrosopumilaceae archaeon]